MSLKSYQHQTLNGNWFEERSTPLKGVIASYKKFEKYGRTASQDTFKEKKPERKKDGPVGMIKRVGDGTSELYRPETYGYSRKIPISNSLESETATRAAFGTYGPRKKASLELSRASCRRPAGGHPGQRPEKPMATSGMIGEVLKESDEPQNNTAAQRSWQYSLSPELFPRKSNEGEHDASYMSIKIEEKDPEKAMFEPKPRRITFGLTNTHEDLQRMKGSPIFQDDIQ